jgi:eukaryotic-like serine/threonine-protein kinase
VSARTFETRSYRIVELLGEGGFGKVYRARMENADGFSKDVAVKLLTERSPPEDVLARFRDESRVLGLVRDRAVVAVDPPTQLGGRWAVIMEYVPGCSCQALTRQHGTLTPKVALGIVGEVARALDHVFRQLGPTGTALELVHRDLKPANLQITPSGEVKILDFGVARANYEAREAHTTRSIQGTFGYIAPERLQGIDTPAADIYSLGMVLYKIVTGGPTDPK